MPIGPSLPPHLAHLASGGGGGSRSPSPPAAGPVPVVEDEEEDEDDYGPALPPHLAAARSNLTSSSAPLAGPSQPSAPTTAGPSRSPAGPTVGPAPPGNYGTYDDDDSDDEIGPKPVPSGGAGESRSAIQEFMEREERRRQDLDEQNKPKVLKREEWMLVPPTSGVLSNVDPLRKRPTTFSRSTADPAKSTDSTVWTETPAEKQQRIADQVAGIKRKKDKAGERVLGFDEEVEERRKRVREEEIRMGVQKHTEAQRGPSLLNQHASNLSKKKDEDDAPAIWDHSRDMGITGRLLSDQERNAKIKEARGLGDRFGHGKAGAYSM